MTLNRRLTDLERQEPSGYAVAYVQASRPADPPERFQTAEAARAWHAAHRPASCQLILVTYEETPIP